MLRFPPSTLSRSILPSLMVFSVSISPLASMLVSAASGLPNIFSARVSKRRTPRPWIDLASCLAYPSCFSDARGRCRCAAIATVGAVAVGVGRSAVAVVAVRAIGAGARGTVPVAAVAVGGATAWAFVAPLLAGRCVQLASELVLHGLAGGDEGVLHALLKALQIVLQKVVVGLERDVARRTDAAIVGGADLLRQAGGDGHGHGISPLMVET